MPTVRLLFAALCGLACTGSVGGDPAADGSPSADPDAAAAPTDAAEPTDAGSAPPADAFVPPAGWQSDLVGYDPAGRLVYTTDGEGNRIPDFSHAGYRLSEAPIPDVPVVLEVSPGAGDDTARVQDALDAAGALPLGPGGFRGAVLLRAGTYEIAGTVHVRHDGVVLRGEGDGADPAANTVLVAVGDVPHQREVIVLGSGNDHRWRDEVAGSRVDIVTERATVGARELQVADASGLAVGDPVVVYHPCTDAWLAAVDHGATGADAPWEAGDQPLVFARRIAAVAGNTVTLDVPLFDHLDRSLSQSVLYVHDRAGVVVNVGLERLRVDIETAGGEDEDHAWSAVALVGVEDAWVREVTALHFGYAGVVVRTGARITVEDVRALDPVAIVTGSRMYNFNASPGQQVLFTRCEATNGRHHFVSNGTSWTSGVVFHRCVSRGANAASEGHRRWSMGLLYDNIVETDMAAGKGVIGLYNRGDYGTGHGWAAVHSVAWNYDVGAGRGYIQKPPTAQNYAVGGAGTFTGDSPPAPFDQPEGWIEGVGTPDLVPESLFEAQLADRL